MDYILPLLIIGGDDTTFCNSRLSKDQEAGESVIYEESAKSFVQWPKKTRQMQI